MVLTLNATVCILIPCEIASVVFFNLYTANILGVKMSPAFTFAAYIQEHFRLEFI